MIRAMLVDDEQPARDRLRKMLDELGGVEVVGEAQDGDEALKSIASERPDLIFLDIQMPGLTGMQVASSLDPPRPRIIFCTAYDQYAIDAFELHATDYLLKPVSKKRLGRALERVRREVEEQRSHQRELDDASQTQARLLPQSLPRMEHLDYAGVCRAARGVGGDYYDFLPLGDGRLGIAVGDVSGKGLYAGLLVASLQAQIQGLAASYPDRVGELVAELNRRTHDSTDSNRYATLFYGVFCDRSRTLTYVNAGHPPPLWFRRAEDRVERLPAEGTVVGLLPDAEYPVSSIELGPGDALAIFSDGVSEAEDGTGQAFGDSRLESLLREHPTDGADELRDRIVSAIDGFSVDPGHDDLTIVTARVR